MIGICLRVRVNVLSGNIALTLCMYFYCTISFFISVKTAKDLADILAAKLNGFRGKSYYVIDFIEPDQNEDEKNWKLNRQGSNLKVRKSKGKTIGGIESYVRARRSKENGVELSPFYKDDIWDEWKLV